MTKARTTQPATRPDAWVVRPASNGQYYWVQVAPNGEVRATSEMYTRRGSAIQGARAAAGPDAEVRAEDAVAE